jgi:hypothetical protein
MSISALAIAAAGSAATGAASGFLNRKKGRDTKVTPEFAKEQKPFMAAAQMQIPFFLNMLTGQTPDFLKRYLQQTRGSLSRQTQQGIQGLLSKIGQLGGGNFGPQAQAQMGNIFQSQVPSLSQGLTQTRNQFVQQALQQMGRWSEITPQGSTTRTPKQPGPGATAAAGAMQGIGRGMGTIEKQEFKNAGFTVNPLSPQQKPLGAGTTLGGSSQAQSQNISLMLKNLLRQNQGP